jgi:hypothetical protein
LSFAPCWTTNKGASFGDGLDAEFGVLIEESEATDPMLSPRLRGGNMEDPSVLAFMEGEVP